MGNYIEITILTLINTFSVFLIIVVLSNSYKDKLYRWFVIMTVFLICWVDFSYLGFIETNHDTAIIFYRINSASVVAFLYSAYIFYIENFLKIYKRIFKLILFLFSTSFIGIALFSDTIIQNVTKREWGNEIVFGTFNNYFTFFIFLITCLFIYYFISRYFQLPTQERSKIIYFLTGSLVFIIFNVVFNIFTTSLLNTSQFQHLGDYSALAFLGFTAFAILRHKFLGVKVALTAFLISIIGVLLIIDILLLSHSLLEQGIKVIIFIFFVGTSIVLLRSVLTEIKQREQIESINKITESKNRDLVSLFRLLSSISKTLDLDQVAQTAANSLPQDENMIGASIAMYNN